MLFLLSAACVTVTPSRVIIVEGAFSAIYGDPPDALAPSLNRYFLALNGAHTIELQLDSLLRGHASSLVRFDRARVRASGVWLTKDSVLLVVRIDSLLPNPSRK